MVKYLYILLLVLNTSFFAISQEADIDLDEAEEIVVSTTGTIASLKSGIERQKKSNQVVSVIDSDALGEFPDETAAESVRRLSGVSVENDQGEGRYVTLRGMSGALNAVTLNGATIPAPESGRKVLLDGLPTELLDSIEVYKTLVPSQDLEGIGGRIEFKTKRATDLDERLIKFRYDVQYNEFVDDADSPKYSFTFGDKINDNFGAIFGYTYQSKHIISNNNEVGYEPWKIDDYGNKYLGRDWEMRYYDLTREREGYTLDMDLLVNDNTALFFNYLYKEYTDDEVRHKDEYRARNVIESTITPVSAAYQRITADKESKKRIETRTIETQVFGMDTVFAGFDVRMQVSSSFAEEADDNNVDAKFRAECRIREGVDACGTFNWSNPKFLRLDLAPAAANLRDPESYEWDEF